MDILIHSISLTGIRELREELLTKLHEFIPHKSFEYYDNKVIRICHHDTKTIRIRFVYGVFLDGVKVLEYYYTDTDSYVSKLKMRSYYSYGYDVQHLSKFDDIINLIKKEISEEGIIQKGSRSVPEIEKVIFDNPATIILWGDGTKTVVKLQSDDPAAFDKEKGLITAITKKALGNEGRYYEELKKYLKEEEE